MDSNDVGAWARKGKAAWPLVVHDREAWPIGVTDWIKLPLIQQKRPLWYSNGTLPDRACLRNLAGR